MTNELYYADSYIEARFNLDKHEGNGLKAICEILEKNWYSEKTKIKLITQLIEIKGYK